MRLRAGLAVLLGVALALPWAGASAYELKPKQVADGVYVVEGLNEHFTRANKGDIVNTGFIVSQAGVIVIDTGPSKAYGMALREAIASVTRQPVVAVYITHQHPDHFLGNQAFHDVPIAALPATKEIIKRDGDALTDGMYRMVGGAMAGTDPVVPAHEAKAGIYQFGDRRIEIIAAQGHSGHHDSDLMILDHNTGTLFAGDIVFHNRAPTTPSADLAHWLEALDAIDGMDIKVLVPGHGPVANDHGPVDQTRRYLVWLDQHLQQAASRGLHMAEVVNLPVAEEFRGMAVIEEEYKRSVAHLYASYLRASFQPLRQQ